jgi:hypothetical protein
MKEIEDPTQLISGRNYYIEKVTQESGGREKSEGKAVGIHFIGTEPFDKNKHYYVGHGAVLGFSRIVFQEGKDLVMFKKVIPLNPKKHAHMAKITHFKPYHTYKTSYNTNLGYKFYEITQNNIYDKTVRGLSSTHLSRAPFLKELNESLMQQYLGTRSKRSSSKKGGKLKKRGRRTRKKSQNRKTKRLLH